MLRYAFLLPLALAAAPASAQSWQVDRADSSVGFETTVSGGAVTGEFSDWTAEIVLDPADLDRADYGVGSSSWGSAAAEVTLVLHIEADAAE